jgi:hypothetical protein
LLGTRARDIVACMRSCIWIGIVIAAAACSAACSNDKTDKSDKSDHARASDHASVSAGVGAAAKPAKKLPPSDKPLAALAADPGGATGAAQWATAMGGLGTDSPRGIVATADDVIVVGTFEGDCTFGALGTRHSNGATDAFVARLDPKTGAPTWVQTFGGAREDVARAVAIRGDTIIVVGNFLDELKLGEFAHKSDGSDDLFVAAFDRKGEPQWLWTAGGINSDGANAVAATPDGGWVIGGSFRDTATIGSSVLTSKGGTDAVLIKLAATGEVSWVKQFGGFYDDTILHLAVDVQGSIFVQGEFRDVADWGGKPLKAGGGSDFDVVLAKYDANGEHVWSQRFGNAFNDVAGGVTVDRAGFVTMAGSFDKEITFGSGDDHNSLGESDIFVARFTTDGKLVWANTYGAEREDIGYDIASDDAGNTVTTGWFQGSVDFGTGALASKGNKDVFALKLDPAGKVVWAQSWGDHDHDQGRAIAIDDKGAAYVTGIFRFTLSIGPARLESVRADGDRIPHPDVFVVKLAR